MNKITKQIYIYSCLRHSVHVNFRPNGFGPFVFRPFLDHLDQLIFDLLNLDQLTIRPFDF